MAISISIIGIQQGDAQIPNSSDANVNQDQITKQGTPAAPGTYQFIVIPTEYGDPFTNDYLVMIENYRDQNQERVLPLTQTTKVRIPSRASIQQAEYKPLQEIVYIQNHKPTGTRR